MVLGSLQNCPRYWTFTLSLPPEMWGGCQKRNRAGILSPRIASSSGKMEAGTALFFHHIPPKTSPCKSNTWANFLATDWIELIPSLCTEQHLPVNSWPCWSRAGGYCLLLTMKMFLRTIKDHILLTERKFRNTWHECTPYRNQCWACA